jgi:beta-fructofuranosidase
VLHATSKDNKSFTKDYDNIVHAPKGYSTNDFRDPQVYRTDDGYLMLVGARKENESAIVYY